MPFRRLDEDRVNISLPARGAGVREIRWTADAGGGGLLRWLPQVWIPDPTRPDATARTGDLILDWTEEDS